MSESVTRHSGNWWICVCSCHRDANISLERQHDHHCCAKCPRCHLNIAGSLQLHLEESHSRVASS